MAGLMKNNNNENKFDLKNSNIAKDYEEKSIKKV